MPVLNYGHKCVNIYLLTKNHTLMKFFKYIFLFTSIISISSCTNHIFEVKPDENINGLKIVIDNPSISNLNIVMVHGMGVHPIGNKSTEDYQNEIATRLNFELSSEETKPEECHIILDSTYCVIELKVNDITLGHLGWRTFNRTYKGKLQTLNFFELSWDFITTKIQESIFNLDMQACYKDNITIKHGQKTEKIIQDNRRCMIENDDIETDRALVNSLLKKFVNVGFSDAALYIGDFGPTIRLVIREGLSQIPGLIIQSSPANSLSDLSLDNQIILIADSLGSAVTFDSIAEIRDMNAINPVAESQQNILYFSELITKVYMNANQLPLILLGQLKNPNGSIESWLENYPCNGITDYFNSTRILLRNRNLPKLNVIAFTDPNDALSYQIPSQFKACAKDTEIFNVSISNAQLNWFGVLANPLKAHTQGFKRPKSKAIDVIIDGYH